MSSLSDAQESAGKNKLSKHNIWGSSKATSTADPHAHGFNARVSNFLRCSPQILKEKRDCSQSKFGAHFKQGTMHNFWYFS